MADIDDVPTVLVADDDLQILAAVRTFLRQKGYRVIEASDGDEALRLVSERKPALVLLDVMMPGRSGWEVCRAIRDDSELAATRIVMLTGIGESLNAMTSPLYGADAFMNKPFELDQLGLTVAQMLNDRERTEPTQRSTKR